MDAIKEVIQCLNCAICINARTEREDTVECKISEAIVDSCTAEILSCKP